MTARRFILIALCFGAVLLSVAQRTTRRTPRRTAVAQTVERVAAAPGDTITEPGADSVAVSGFEKPLRATRESMYVTNHSSRDITSLALEIEYLTTSGRQLHKREVDVTADIPAGETRMVEIASFDRQGLYHYRLTIPPKRAAQATPFDVRVKVKYITVTP